MNIEKIIEESIKLEQSRDTSTVLNFELETFYENEKLKQIRCQNQIKFVSNSNINELTVSDIITINNFYDLIANDIKSKDLTPYEQYIAAYTIVRTFKEYKYYNNSAIKDQNISDQSRNPYLILNNEWMVCVGYVKMLMAILTRLNINIMEWGVETEFEFHEVGIINLVDSKYNINGYYICDPTADLSSDITVPVTHINMTYYEARIKQNINSGLEYTDLYLENLYIYNVNKEEKFNMYKKIDSNAENYDCLKNKIDKPILAIKTIEAFINVYKTIYTNITENNLLAIKEKMINDYNCLYDAYNGMGLNFKRIN